MTTRKQRKLACRLLLASWLVFTSTPGAQAQFVQRQVGGVSIDADGILRNITIDEQGALKREMDQALRCPGGHGRADRAAKDFAASVGSRHRHQPRLGSAFA